MPSPKPRRTFIRIADDPLGPEDETIRAYSAIRPDGLLEVLPSPIEAEEGQRSDGDNIPHGTGMSAHSVIAHYRITTKLGEGGMGEVWRAIDTKLNRDVAIKLLPEAFAQDASRMARFQNEARVLASLNHPNIAAIYGVEEGALVLEFVTGPTLAERIA